MTIGTTLLGLMGKQDPREALLAKVMASQQPVSAQYAAPAADPAATATAQDPAAAQRTVPTPPQPDAYKSPDDLASLYKELLTYNSKAQNIDRGIGLLGMAFAQPENRGAIAQMFGGENTGINTDPSAIAELSMAMQKNAVQRSQYASQMAALPAIAQKYGIGLDEAKLLLQQGKLEEFITKREEQQFSVDHRPNVITPMDGQLFSTDPTGQKTTVIGGEKKPNVELTKGPNDSVVAVDKDLVLTDPVKAVNTIVGPDKAKDYQIIDGPNGSKLLFNKKNNVVVKSLVPEDTTTPFQKDYQAYVADETMRGTPGDKIQTMDQWKTSHEKTSASKTEVNLDQKGESKFTEKLGEYSAKRYDEIQAAGRNATDTMGQYDLAQKALDTGMYTGPGADLVNTGRKIGNSLGMDVDKSKMEAADVFGAVQNQLALIKRNPESGMGLPGSVSDKDIVFLKQADVNFGASPEGNKQIIQIARKLQQRKIDIANLAADYVRQNHNMDAGFDKVVSDFANAHPLFDDIQIGKPKSDDDRLKEYMKKYGSH